jgi:hypothetical protein
MELNETHEKDLKRVVRDLATSLTSEEVRGIKLNQKEHFVPLKRGIGSTVLAAKWTKFLGFLRSASRKCMYNGFCW